MSYMLANARLIREDTVIGCMTVVDGQIAEITDSGEVPAGAIDCAGDFVSRA